MYYMFLTRSESVTVLYLYGFPSVPSYYLTVIICKTTRYINKYVRGV